MLPGVLLHMVEAPIPGDPPAHGSRSNSSIDDVHHIITFVDHIHNIGIPKLPQIIRLPAGTRIKSGAIKFCSPPWRCRSTSRLHGYRFATQNVRCKFLRKCIVVIQSQRRHLVCVIGLSNSHVLLLTSHIRSLLNNGRGNPEHNHACGENS